MNAAPPISVQLYTLREEVAADFPAVLARLGAKGYAGVELAGLRRAHARSSSPTRSTQAGLVVSSAHVGYRATPTSSPPRSTTHQALGCDTVGDPGARRTRRSPISTRCSSRPTASTAGRRRRARAGMTLGYHNHFWEFTPMPDGRPALLHFFEHLAPDVVRRGRHLLGAGRRRRSRRRSSASSASRVGLLHVKDGPADEPPSPMVAVGDGVGRHSRRARGRARRAVAHRRARPLRDRHVRRGRAQLRLPRRRRLLDAGRA